MCFSLCWSNNRLSVEIQLVLLLQVQRKQGNTLIYCSGVFNQLYKWEGGRTSAISVKSYSGQAHFIKAVLWLCIFLPLCLGFLRYFCLPWWCQRAARWASGLLRNIKNATITSTSTLHMSKMSLPPLLTALEEGSSNALVPCGTSGSQGSGKMRQHLNLCFKWQPRAMGSWKWTH